VIGHRPAGCSWATIGVAPYRVIGVAQLVPTHGMCGVPESSHATVVTRATRHPVVMMTFDTRQDRLAGNFVQLSLDFLSAERDRRHRHAL
jgi:hypothetical protein